MQKGIEELREASTITAKEYPAAQIDDETVILNMEEGRYYGLNTVGARIWALIQEPRTVSDIIDVLLSEYEVERDQCRNEVLQLLHSLAEKNMILIRKNPDSERKEEQG